MIFFIKRTPKMIKYNKVNLIVKSNIFHRNMNPSISNLIQDKIFLIYIYTYMRYIIYILIFIYFEIMIGPLEIENSIEREGGRKEAPCVLFPLVVTS